MADDKLESNIDDWMEELTGEDNPFDEESNGVLVEETESEALAPASQAPESEDGPLGQDDIDSLFAGGDDSGPAAAPPQPQADEDGPLGQNDIDSLFAGGDDSAPAAAPPQPQVSEDGPIGQHDIDALFAADNEEEVPLKKTGSRQIHETEDADFDMDSLGEQIDRAVDSATQTAQTTEEESDAPIDQNEIDALFAAGDSEEAAADLDEADTTPATPGKTEDFFQSNMDEYLTADTTEKPSARAAATPPNQSDLDQLLGETIPPHDDTQSPDRSEMDQLFASHAGEEEELFPSEPALPGQADDTFSFSGNELDEGVEDELEVVADADADDDRTEFDLGDRQEESTGGGKKAMLPAWLLKTAKSRVLWASTGLGLALLLGASWYLNFYKPGKPPAIPPADRQQFAQQAPPSPPAPLPTPPRPETTIQETAAPLLQPATKLAEAPVSLPVGPGPALPGLKTIKPPPPAPAPARTELTSLEYALDPNGTPLELMLTDPSNSGKAVSFALIALPEKGQLAGELPRLTYRPNPDFAGEDRFAYRVSDEQGVIGSASVRITGPTMAAPAKPKPAKAMEPRMPLVLAENLQLKTTSTGSLYIDWPTLWEQSNDTPYNRKVTVEILDKKLIGTLTRLNRDRHLFKPDPYASGQAWLDYRFNLAGIRSKIRRLTIEVESGDPPPAIELKPLAKEVYSVGETVIIDASATRDDQPASLVFSWQQQAGVPVRLRSLNASGSAISFMVPSHFYTVDYPNPIIRLTVRDQSGQQVEKAITVKAEASRTAALWRGLHADHTLVGVD